MRKQAKKLAARIKKALASLIVLSIFILPVFLTARWGSDVLMSGDKRPVYSLDELAAHKGSDCAPSTGDVKPFDEPLITITFDDGWESIYSNGAPVLEKYCIDSTQYILGDHFDDPLYLSLDQARSFRDSGHEIASHTMTHPNLTLLAPGDLEWELSESSKLLSNEFGTMHEFASPLGASDPAMLKMVKKYYRSHRNTVGDPGNGVTDVDINVRRSFDPYQINAYTVRDTTEPEEIEALIRYTIKTKGWLVLTYHQVDESGEHYAVTKDVLDKHMAIVAKSGARTTTMGQFLDAWEAKRGER